LSPAGNWEHIRQSGSSAQRREGALFHLAPHKLQRRVTVPHLSRPYRGRAWDSLREV
jgi:hypothetical protein